MSLFFYYGAGDLGNTAVRLGSGFVLTECAETGIVGMSNVQVDDLTSALDLVGLHSFSVDETTCTTWKRMFTGYFADRSLGRADSLILGVARRWDCTVTDLNAAMQFEIIQGASANRPAETDIARITWWLGSGYTGPIGSALTFVDSATPKNMDASDYRGRTGADLLTDCAGQSGYNFFVAYDQTSSTVLLHYYAGASTLNTSTIKISNVLADVDGSTVYAPSSDAKLYRDPSSIYTGIVLAYGAGADSVYVTNATTLANVGHKREMATVDPTVSSSAQATTKANALLTDSATELDRITCVLDKVPAASVNLIRAGQRLQVKFTHLPGFTSYTYVRVSRRTVQQAGDTDIFYRVTLELSLYVKITRARSKHGPPAGQTDPVPDATGANHAACAIGAATLAQLTLASGVGTFGFGGIGVVRSNVSPNSAYTVCGCAIGCGGWGPGKLEAESWYTIALANETAADFGILLTIGAGGGLLGVAAGAVVGVGHGTPTDLGQWEPVGGVSLVTGGTILIPRSSLSASLQNYVVIAPDWHADTGAFFCASQLVNGCTGPVVGGEGNSGYSTAPAITAQWQNFATSGLAPWVSGVGDVDGANAVYTLIGWNGFGTPKVRIGPLVLTPVRDYTSSGSAATVTLNRPAPANAEVAFRYQVQA